MKLSEEQKEKMIKTAQTYASQILSPIALAWAVQMWAWRSQTFKNRMLALENAYVTNYEKYKERVICRLEDWLYEELEDHLDLLN